MPEWVKDSIVIVASGVLPLDAAVRKVETVEYEVANCRVEIGDGCLEVTGEVQGKFVFYDWEGGKESKSKSLKFDEKLPWEDVNRVLEVFVQPFIKDSFVRVNGMRNLFQHILIGIELCVLENINQQSEIEETVSEEQMAAEQTAAEQAAAEQTAAEQEELEITFPVA